MVNFKKLMQGMSLVLFTPPREYKIYGKGEGWREDAQNMTSDWQMVGADMRSALKKSRNKHESPNYRTR